MMLLAIDQSVRRSGWAVMEARPMRQFGIVGHGWFGAQAKTSEDRVNSFIDQVDALVLDYGPALLVWEKPNAFMGARGVNARTLVLTRLDQALRDLAKLRALQTATVAASSWRARVLGKGAGRFSGDRAKAAALAYWAMFRVEVRDHNEAEAMCMGVWACSQIEVASHG